METNDSAPKWTQLESIERRVLGVLVEKAKTTPDAYPLTLKGIVTAANQKSNRYPQMSLEEHQAEDAIDSLRTKGAVSIIQGDGRVEKFRHLAYDWLGVSKVELAVMAELLLRGAQTVGELRGRAARMEPIKGMAELGPLLESLVAKSLVIYLTPLGRGAVVTHNLYQDRELEKVRREHGTAMPASAALAPVSSATPTSSAPSPASSETLPSASTSSEVQSLRKEVAQLRRALASHQEETEQKVAELQTVLEDLQRQLGI